MPIPFAPVTAALELTPGKADLIEWSKESLIRRDGANAKVLWDALHPAKPFVVNRDPAPSMRSWMRGLRPSLPASQARRSPRDLDGDGTCDLLWVLQSASAFLALSGKDGSMLWNYVAELDGPGGPKPDGLELNVRDTPSTRASQTIGVPTLADVDRDGTQDLIASIVFAESGQETARRLAAGSPGAATNNKRPLHRRFVVAVSGRSGRWIWSYPLDKTFIDVPQETWSRSSALVQGKRSALVEVVDGTQWLGLDPATGRPHAGPFELGFAPVRPPQHADLDGDGDPETLALGPGPPGGRLLSAFSTTTGRELWNANIGTTYNHSQGSGPASESPLVVDLDGDGRSEIVAADSGPMPPLSGYRGVKLLDGLTGKVRWHRPMRPDTRAADGLADVIVAPRPRWRWNS